MNQDRQQRDTSQIVCKYFRTHGVCKVPGCKYLHRIDAVKQKAFRKVFAGQDDQIKKQYNPNNTQNQQWRPYQYNNQQSGNYNYTNNRFNQSNQDQSNQQTSQNSQIVFDNLRNNNQNYGRSFQNNQNNNSYNSYQQNNYENKNQQLQKTTIGLQLLYKMNYENLKGFLQMIQIGNNYYFGLINNKGVSFIRYDESNGVDILQKIDFNVTQEVEDAIIQEFQSSHNYKTFYCLSVIVKEKTLKGIIIYPDIVNQQQTFVKISDVSNTQIKMLRVNTISGELIMFSSDGFIRVFTLPNLPNQPTLKYCNNLQEVILSVQQLTNIGNDFTFLIVSKQGNIYQYQNYGYTKIHSIQNQTIIDISIDQDSKRVYILTKLNENGLETSQIYLLNQNCIVEGPVYIFKFPLLKIQGFKDFDQNNCLLVSDNRGQLDILKETNQNDQIKFLRISKQTSNMTDIQKLLLFKMTNVNQVTERMIFIQRNIDTSKYGQQNFEFYRLFQIF